MSALFSSYTARGMTLRNRIVMSPMCQYSAGPDGQAIEWHFVHYGSRAVGGAGLILIEATSVESRGRLSLGDLGIWEDAQIAPLARIVDFCHHHGAKVGIQLAHGGRKAWSADKGIGPEPIVGPSTTPFNESWQRPNALSAGEIEDVVGAFAAGARRARAAGFDLIELHGAHGYLINQFLSPLVNQREDHFGGDHQARARFGVQVVEAVRSEWPAEAPLSMRLSCSEYAPGSNLPEDAVIFARIFADHGVDLIDCSSGGAVDVPANLIPTGPGYQVPFAEKVRREAGVPTIGLGLITEPTQAEEILTNGQADLIALGRALLREPNWTLRAAGELGAELEWPVQYQRAKR